MTSHRPAQKADPEEVGVREFREKVATYMEPVRVYHTRGHLTFLGTWYPAGQSEDDARLAVIDAAIDAGEPDRDG